jgi:hypothetical protein
MKKHLILLLAVILFCSTVGFLSHHHADGTSHDDCPMCVAQHHSPAFVSSHSSIHPSTAEFSIVLEALFSLPDAVSLFSTSRAPPGSFRFS